ncbi:acetylcholine receptor subunit alpha-like 2 isoform X1 [Neodiprion lecontei]|uniref:Acetylcholine receptor subunit alpha-like 2 isoform X1 n=1 Tax=Neodiprion lecontei TaxID=441921 RepID=A0A6J0BNI4_NEOLC|nr:acetylcholine receptor subunit alpha-like 2 isoform X1 [Neodiprion lecontei]
MTENLERISLRTRILVLYGVFNFLPLQQCSNVKLTVTDVPGKPVWNETWTDHLRKDLLLNYDKFARPAQHFNTTTVTIDITIRHVTIEDLKSMMTVYAWVKMTWIDEKLKWNASHYGGLTHLHLGDHEVWQPDIVLYNSAAGSTIDHYGNTHCIVSGDGTVLWVPPSQFMVFCDLDLRFWPFDTQVCFLRLGSWTFDGEQIDLQFSEVENQPDLLTHNSEWLLKGLTRERNVAHYPCCPEAYIDVTYNLTMQRQSPNYAAIVMTPATAIVFLTLVIFWLPPQSEDRITVAACTMVLISLFLIYFNQKLPATAHHTPLILHFYNCSLYLVSISLIISVMVINMSKRSNARRLPWRVKQFLVGQLGKILWLDEMVQLVKVQRANPGEEMREGNVTDGNQSIPGTLGTSSLNDGDRQNILTPPKSSQLEWTLAAMVLDRIAFLLYCFVFVILAIRCSV